MPKKRGVTKKLTNSRYFYVGFAIFVLSLFVVGLGSIPTGNVITGNDIIVNADNVVIDGRSISFDRYSLSYCDGPICKDPGSDTCAPTVCQDVASGEASGSGGKSSRLGTEGFFSETIDAWENGTMEATVAKYLLFALLTIFLLTILNTADFPPTWIAKAIFSLAIAFIGIAYVTPAEVLGVVQGYSALALALIVIIPFMILMFFSAQLLVGKNKLNVGSLLLQRMLWIMFSLFLLYKLVLVAFAWFGWVDLPGYNASSFITLLVILIGFIFSLIIAYNNKGFVKFVFNTLKTAKVHTTKMQTLEGIEHQTDDILEELKG